MKIRSAAAILLLALFAFSTIATIQIRPAKASSSHTLSLPDAELIHSEFYNQWGVGILTLKTDVAGPGVQFDFTGLDPSSGTGVGDNFPLNPLAGGTGTYNSDFTAYTRYSMNVTNVGSDPVKACLYMNTGFTNGHPEWDTYWESETVTLNVGESAIVTLDFSSCYKIWNAEDDPVPEWQHPDGTGGWPVRRLDQVSNIGFQVFSGGSAGGGSVVLSELTAPLLYTDPAHIQKQPGDVESFFDVYVTLEDFANFAGFDLNVTWDGTLITRASVDYTTALNALWGTGKWAVPVEQAGHGFYKIVALALATSATNTGASDLFKLTFRIDRSCNFPLSTPIHFAVAKLSDDSEPIPNPIIPTVTDGAYYISDTVPSLKFELIEPYPSSTAALTDDELMLPEFTKEWGPGALTLKTDVAEIGVQFDFTGLTSADTGIGDNHPVNVLAGGAYKDYGHGFAGYYDFSGYARYGMIIENVGTEPVDVCLFVNTGWTSDWSGGLWIGPDGYGASPARDTHWKGDWIPVGPSETKAVCLDFASATCYNAGDDPVVEWRHPDGTSRVPVRRLDEVSNIGFQVHGNGAGSIILKEAQLYAEYCTTFQLSVYATHICATLKDYDLSILYSAELLAFVDVDAWGVLGDTTDQANVDGSVPGVLHLWDTGGVTWTGDKGLLFTLTFHVTSDDPPPPDFLAAQITLHDATLSFNEGTIPLSGITVIGSPVLIIVKAGVTVVHDIAVVNITTSKTGCTPFPTVGQGRSLSIAVLVENQGDATETFNVTVAASRLFSVVELELYGSAALGWGFAADSMTSPGPAITVHQGDRVSLTLTSQDGLVHRFFVDYDGNTVPSAGEPTSPDFTTTIAYAFTADTVGSFTYYCQYHKVIMYGTFTVNPLAPTVVEIGTQSTTLDAGASTTLTFDWDTAGYLMGNYTLIATADTVVGEDDTADNTLMDGWLFVTIAGDIDGDLGVDIFDIVRMAGVYGVAQPDPRYDPNSDVDGDGDIDIFDVVAAAANYGKEI